LAAGTAGPSGTGEVDINFAPCVLDLEALKLP
jgi:hypothetical protein